MLPISVPRGANIVSSAMVAVLMNFIVMSEVVNTGTSAASAALRNCGSGFRSRLKTAQGIA